MWEVGLLVAVSGWLAVSGLPVVLFDFAGEMVGNI